MKRSSGSGELERGIRFELRGERAKLTIVDEGREVDLGSAGRERAGDGKEDGLTGQPQAHERAGAGGAAAQSRKKREGAKLSCCTTASRRVARSCATSSWRMKARC